MSSTEVKEFDRFYNIISSSRGKKTIVAKGVRKPTAKLAGGLEPITYSEIFLAEGRAFDRVTGVIIHNQFNGIKKDLNKIKEIKKFFKLLNWLLMEKSLEKKENRDFFESLIFYMELLEKKDLSDPKLQVVKFAIIWKIINLLGFQPQIFCCANCSEKLKKQSFYQMILPSGVVCENCLGKIKIVSQKQKVSQEIIKILRVFNQKKIETCFKLRLSDKQCREVKILTIVALSHILGRRVDL